MMVSLLEASGFEECRICNEHYDLEDMSLTIDEDNGDRHWYCTDCVKLMESIRGDRASRAAWIASQRETEGQIEAVEQAYNATANRLWRENRKCENGNFAGWPPERWEKINVARQDDNRSRMNWG